MSISSRARRALAALAACLLLPACADDAPPAARWHRLGHDLPAALLSVHGTSARDVWVAGAKAGGEGTLLRWDGTSWARLKTGQPHDLWWVHAFAADDVFITGGGATILRGGPSGVARMTTPGLGAHTVYGLWGAAPDDVWAVGAVAGRDGFIWHFDGERWAEVALPDDLPVQQDGTLPALFKVWGRAADDVWAVGSHGLMLHYDGATWSIVPTGTDELLFTVTGDAAGVWAVGGSAQGVVLGADGGAIETPVMPLLQGVSVGPDGTTWACGAGGAVYARRGGAWREVALDDDAAVQSLHAIWVDPSGGVWTVGGDVLTAALDAGALYHRSAGSLASLPEALLPEPAPAPTSCPADRVDPLPEATMARRWVELTLDAIRRDVPRPGVHARNLFHVAVAMHDAWAACTPGHSGYLHQEADAACAASAEERDRAIAAAAARVFLHRYTKAIGGAVSADCADKLLAKLGLDREAPAGPGAALGARVGAAVVAAFAADGANEAHDYADTTGYAAANPPLVVDLPGAPAKDPDVWQELNLAVAETQNGIIVEAGKQPYIGSNWGFVKGFATPAPDAAGVVHPAGPAPKVADADTAAQVLQVIRRSAQLDAGDGAALDISPGAYGNNPLGSDAGAGHTANPSTGKPYPANIVPRGDFARVLAEFWADGPHSETPPGHWFVLANEVSDRMTAAAAPLRPFGQGEAVDRLRWDVALYLTLGGAVHDAAITAWGLKRATLGPRPITLVRWMAAKGQRSDPAQPSYDPRGLPLEPGLVEVVTAASSAPGQRHHALRFWPGAVAVYAWRGEPGDRASEVGSFGWILGTRWQPYQRRTFVTPAFPGFVSGHSTFSRAAAEVLTAFTGSAFFPSGLGEFVAAKDAYLVFERGPSTEVRLQWATYQDAADQAGQSRLYGGIHVWADDKVGRELGAVVGLAAVEKAKAVLGSQ
jgi:hypothetical protein